MELHSLYPPGWLSSHSRIPLGRTEGGHLDTFLSLESLWGWTGAGP